MRDERGRCIARSGCNLSSTSRYMPQDIASTREPLLWQINEQTKQYESLMAGG